MTRPSPDDLLAQMEALMPWHILARLTQDHDDSGQLTAMARLMRLHIVQKVHGLSDTALDEALRESSTLRRFAGIDEALTTLPSPSALAGFRELVQAEPLALAAISRYAPSAQKTPAAPPAKKRRESAAARKSYVWRFA